MHTKSRKITSFGQKATTHRQTDRQTRFTHLLVARRLYLANTIALRAKMVRINKSTKGDKTLLGGEITPEVVFLIAKLFCHLVNSRNPPSNLRGIVLIGYQLAPI